MKSLVIAEKPSVARDIARVLHCTQKGNGILEGKEYVVTWALGHLVTLADPEEYDKKYMIIFVYFMQESVYHIVQIAIKRLKNNQLIKL